MGTKYDQIRDFELRYLKNQLAHEGQNEMTHCFHLFSERSIWKHHLQLMFCLKVAQP